MSRGTSLTGGRVGLVWLCAILATAIVPPAVAHEWHARRVEDTRVRLHAAALRWADAPIAPNTVWCGPGRRPGLTAATAAARGLSDRLPGHEAWLSRMTDDGAVPAGVQPDAWGQCLLLRVSADGRVRLVLSAGANGVIDTALDGDRPGGDDQMEQLR